MSSFITNLKSGRERQRPVHKQRSLDLLLLPSRYPVCSDCCVTSNKAASVNHKSTHTGYRVQSNISDELPAWLPLYPCGRPYKWQSLHSIFPLWHWFGWLTRSKHIDTHEVKQWSSTWSTISALTSNLQSPERDCLTHYSQCEFAFRDSSFRDVLITLTIVWSEQTFIELI